MADTLREFLVGLGFKVEESSERRFISAIEGATLRANLLATAIEDMARVVVDKVGQVAESYERLYYMSQRALSSVPAIKAFEFAFKQLGSTADEADKALENIGYRLRTQPGFEGWVKGLGVATRDANGQLRQTADLLPEIAKKVSDSHNQGTANVFRQFIGGISDQGWKTLLNPEFLKQYQTAIGSQAAAGIDDAAAKNAAQFEKAYREVWKRLDDMAEGGHTKLFDALTKPMEDFNKWLDEHKTQIDSSVGKISKSLGGLAEQWTIDIGKIILGDDQMKGIDDTTNAITKFLDSLKPLVHELKDFNEASKGWWFTKLINGAAGGTLVSPLPSGPGFVASHGPGVDANQAAGWWKSHAPSWLGGNSGPLSQNGAPISESNPLAVNVVKANVGDGPGSGLFNGAMGAIGRAMGLSGGVGGGVGGAPGGIRARAAGGAPAGNELLLAKQGYDYWRSQGLSHDQALGVLGNERGEQSLGGHVVGDGGSAFGQAQWHPDRVADILRNTGIDVRTAGFLDQQKAMRWEMEHGAGGGHVWDKIRGSKSRSDAVWWMVNGFERPADRQGAAATRLGFADRYGRVITDGPASGASSPAHLGWDKGHSWDNLNSSLPVGPTSTDNSSKSVSSNVTNHFNIQGSGDPATTAGMIGLHMDRSANTISRNLQGAFQ